MPELPEITQLARQIDTTLSGRTLMGIEILQPKSLNIPEDAFRAALCGATIQRASSRGKWILVETDQGWLLINLGMGGEVLLTDRAHLPAKYRLIFDLDNGQSIAINFWWFGYVHYAADQELLTHPMVGKLGPNALDLSFEKFQQLVKDNRGTIKALLLDQSKLAGIGNSYVHGILFLAHLHPLQKLNSLTNEDIECLYDAVHSVLELSLEKGTAFYEMDLFGKKGGFTVQDYLIGCQEGQPCPACGATIEKIKTGGTSSYLCPSCQPMK
jgi:formamidopyrimidine-DNA glycosylase